MIYQCNLEVVLSLSPEAMEIVYNLAESYRGEWSNSLPERTAIELTNFANALRAELDKVRPLRPNVIRSDNRDLL